MLRLDYHQNPNTGQYEYHWNQKGVKGDWNINNHTPAGAGGAELYQFAKYYKYAGAGLTVIGMVDDVYSISVAENKPREISQVIYGWTGAWIGAGIGGSYGATWGSTGGPQGTAAGGLIGGFLGGMIGYFTGTTVSETVWELSETFLTGTTTGN